jgi:hypothetical protein
VSDASPPTQDPEGFIPGYILRNVGVPILLYRLVDGARVPINGDQDADFVTEKLHLRFDANAVATVEDWFDGFRATVPIIQKEVMLGADGSPLVGPTGPVYVEKVVGSEERVYYGQEAFQAAMQGKPMKTIRDTMAAALRCSPETMGERMIQSEGLDYQNAVGVAWALAQGLDPTDAARMLQSARAALAARVQSLGSDMEKMMEQASAETTASPGNPG